MALGLLILAALLLPAAPAPAQVSQKKRELARIQSELRRTLDELDRLKASEQELDEAVSRLKGLDKDSLRRVRRLRESIGAAERRRSDLQSRLQATCRVGGFWTAAMSAEAARHAASAAGRSDFYGTAELWEEEYRRSALLEKARHIKGLQGFQRRTEAAEAQARRRAAELDRNRRRAEAERAGRRREYESKRTELEQTQARMAEAARRAKELEENAKALTALIDKLARAARWRPRKGPVATLDRPRHSLPWPASGRVLLAFGRERDPELGTWTVRQGMTLAPAPAADVVAVAPGTVIFAGPFRSYGLVVILDHGSGFFTVYGGLSRAVRAKGDAVRAGETIGVAGGDAASGRVYFEIRRGAEALDPLEWLEKR